MSQETTLIGSAEKYVLDRLGQHIKDTKYEMKEHELGCAKWYDREMMFWGVVNLSIWGAIAWVTLRPTPVGQKAIPTWVKMYGIVGISSGAFATSWLASKSAARSCLQCFLDTRDKQSEFYLTVRKLMQEHHPNHKQYFKKEKYRLLNPDNVQPKGA